MSHLLSMWDLREIFGFLKCGLVKLHQPFGIFLPRLIAAKWKIWVLVWLKNTLYMRYTYLLLRARGFSLSVASILFWRKKIWTKIIWRITRLITMQMVRLKETQKNIKGQPECTLIYICNHSNTVIERKTALQYSSQCGEHAKHFPIHYRKNHHVSNQQSKQEVDKMDNQVA